MSDFWTTRKSVRTGEDEADDPSVGQPRSSIGRRLTDALFRRPTGRMARRFYREARPHQVSFRETLSALALGPEDRLLELGCGGGTFLAWALATGCSAKAIDHSPEMVALTARQNAAAIRAGRLGLLQADAASLPFVGGEFSAAATTNAFFFFDTPQAVLREVHRTLVPGGRIAIHTAATAPKFIAGRMHLYTDTELLGLLEDAGFECLALRRTGRRGDAQLVTARKPTARTHPGSQ